uniref:Uncharacterized protein n=1 Tax=Strigamia maritima TaxID=126957 RepID=T1JBK6_STRMM
MYEKKEKFMNDTLNNFNNTSADVKCIEDVDILDLLDQYENDADQLWGATDDLLHYEIVTFDKIDTPTNPCTSLEKFKMCEEDCVNTKMDNLTCREPNCMTKCLQQQKFTQFTQLRQGLKIFLYQNLSLYIFEYMFLNSTSSPCVNLSVMEDCHKNCYLDQIKLQNLTCQFPFLPKEIDNDEECIANELACNYTAILGEIRIKVNPSFLCNCARECEKTVITTHYNFEKHNTNTTIFYSFSNWIRKLTEYYSYDFIALLCDVGGYLSLYTGLSCTSIVKLLFHDLKKTFQKLLFSVKKNHFEKKVISNISIMLKEKKEVPHLDKIKIIFILLSFSVCCYIISIRVKDYFKFPVYVTIVLVQDRYIQPPTIVFCSENSDMYEKKEKFIMSNHTFHNVKCIEDVDILDLLIQFENDADQLWEATGDLANYEMAVQMGKNFGKKSKTFVPNFGNLSYLDTVFGRCIKVESGSMEYNPVSAIYYMGFFGEGIRCNTHTKIFLMKTEERIDFLTYNIQPHDVAMTIKFSRQTLDRLDTPTNPCTTLEKFKVCEKSCVSTKMEDENIICRLPFLNSTNITMCKTPADAKATRKSYIKVHANTDAIHDCNCDPPCSHTIYTNLIDYCPITKEMDILVLTMYEFDSNIREMLKEELAVPFIKLVCDIGSITGFFLGLSILLCFKLVEKFLNRIKVHL